ncbi:hypothetical protein LDENG_00000640 [Lucifuga dentata]|nr:hypothetical protein LDENG_00000640 [Lucifuga dentata]
MWRIPQARLSFLIRSTYDILPCPRNLHLWYGSEVNCHLSGTQNPSLQHILTGCKSALTRYRWCHNRVLRKLAEVLEYTDSKQIRPAYHPSNRGYTSSGKGLNHGTLPRKSDLS